MKIFKSPKFWEERDSKITRFLVPFSKIYDFVCSIRRNSITSEKASVPVICVGSVVQGGSGKTPTVELICHILKEHSYKPHILSGGYGGYLKNVVRVNKALHSYLQVGDEALLLSFVAPTWVGKNRVNSSKAATLSGADVLVMDDGFQNNSLEKDLQVLVVDSNQEFGNGHLFPAGPLKENIESGIKKSDVVLIVGEKNAALEDRIKNIKVGVPVCYAQMEVVETVSVENKRVIGFCGLGYPEKFKKTLLNCGFDLLDFIAFSDHHPYTITEIQKLIKAAKSMNAHLVTTKKDFVKIPEVFRSEISTIGIKLSLQDEGFEKIILESLQKNDKMLLKTNTQ